MYYCRFVQLLLLCWIARIYGDPIDLWIPQESWDGSYACGFFHNPLSLAVSSYDLSTQQVVVQITMSTPHGEYIYASDGTAGGSTLNLQHEYDIQKPSFGIVLPLNLNGAVSGDGNSYSGSVAAFGCSSFTLQRTRSYGIQGCGMTLSFSGSYHVMQNIVALAALNTPCISITSDSVSVTSAGFKIDAGTCSDCTGISITGRHSVIYSVELVNFAVGISTTADNTQVSDVSIHGNQVLDGTMGIAVYSSFNLFQRVSVSNLASSANATGIYLSNTKNNSVINPIITNLTSLATTGKNRLAAGIYIDVGNTVTINGPVISQISAFKDAFGIYFQNSTLSEITFASVADVTASGASAIAAGYYFDANTDLACEYCSASTITAKAHKSTAYGFSVNAERQQIKSIDASYITADSAYGVQTTSVSQMWNFTISYISGLTEAYGIYEESSNVTLSNGSIRHVSSNQSSYAIYIPEATTALISATNISITEGQKSYGIFLGNVPDPYIQNTTVLQTTSGISVYENSSAASQGNNTYSTCSVNYAMQVCYPANNLVTCCSNCRQVQTPDLCEGCINTNCPSGFTCSGTTGGGCVDINECQDYDICGPGFNCQNTNGSYSCSDINECVVNATICGPGYRCTNTYGSYTCTDINECVEGTYTCPPSTMCVNTPGSYQCKGIEKDECTTANCSTGFYCVDGNNTYTCVDVNECADKNKCPPGFSCQNTNGSFVCNDINECNDPDTQCPVRYHCVNKWGSYSCVADPPTLVWFNYTQSDYFPYFANFSWSFKEAANPISYYVFVVTTVNATSKTQLNATEFLEFGLATGNKYSFYILAVDTNGSVSDTRSPIVIKNLLSGAVCNEFSCENGGKCLPDGTCECSGVWSGSDCNFKTNNMTVLCPPDLVRAVLSDTSAATYFNVTITNLYELNTTNQEVLGSRVDLSSANYTFQENLQGNPLSWTYGATLINGANISAEMLLFKTATVVSFAGQNTTIPPRTLKINFGVFGWPFLHESDRLAVTFNLSFPGKLEGYQLDSAAAMNWINLHFGGVQIYGSFFDTVMIDGHLDTVDFVWNGDGTITAKIPHFSEYVEIDPNFSVLVGGGDSSNPWHSTSKLDKNTAIIIGSVVGGLFLVLVVLIIFRKPLINRVQIFMGGKRKDVKVDVEYSTDMEEL
eukprot:Phypoly_transcript_01236.p1 GENE.Phypoly_transcript_01236~~Phypoly_transcript_01236.p1  ORF type:complete len:1163 (+),score=76.93 Phypoly_transcript_01236:30-3518(+)